MFNRNKIILAKPATTTNLEQLQIANCKLHIADSCEFLNKIDRSYIGEGCGQAFCSLTNPS